MPAAPTDTAPVRHEVALPALWYGLFGAAAAWSLQELVSYALMSHACFPSWRPLAAPATPGAWSVAVGVSVLALVIGATANLTALRAWRRTRAGHANEESAQLEVGEGRVRFMALSGMIVSSTILVNIVMNAIVLFLVPPCG